MAAISQLTSSLESIADKLRAALGANLYSCMLYGSAVRGDLVPGVSDVNVLLVLEESTPQAHEAIAAAIEDSLPISPMVIARRGMERTLRVFAPKFLSIRRNYRVLHGADFLREFSFDPAQERFLIEQSLRNYQMRLTHAFITMGDDRRRFTRFVFRVGTGVVTNLSEILRLDKVSLPPDRLARIPIISRGLDVDASVLADLATLKRRGKRMRAEEVRDTHGRLHTLLSAVLSWIEQRWPSP